ncbi:MAG TPA: methyl-accepting chemotaxis protein, partial [Solirubrobacteraceae bacterium]|nr:methyl-accepting chemotaxis protein [Solirubrobacteraceae bacterium]
GAVQAMGALEESSAQITTILDTISTIAKETDLLALNAAIEAARAGDHGRGFAVVAEEVRKLAESSQTATGEIAQLVGEIQSQTRAVADAVQRGAERADEGSAVVEQARDAFATIEAQVAGTVARVEQISEAASQIVGDAAAMRSGLEEIAAVATQSTVSSEQVAAVTEQTSASAQEITATAESLAGTAEQLAAIVDRFTLEPAGELVPLAL